MRSRAGRACFRLCSQEVHSRQDAAGKGWKDSPAEEQNRRSVYLDVKRGIEDSASGVARLCQQHVARRHRTGDDDRAAGADVAE